MIAMMMNFIDDDGSAVGRRWRLFSFYSIHDKDKVNSSLTVVNSSHSSFCPINIPVVALKYRVG
jgi:hypothetical protein